MNRLLMGLAYLLAVLCHPIAATAQDVAPLFQQAPTVLYETYRGVSAPEFNEYFEGLVAKYEGTDQHPWGIYTENATVAYRITALPEGLTTLMEVTQARNAGAQEFTDEERALWNSSWDTRQAVIYNAAPAMSVVPEDFDIDDIRELPFNRVSIYHIKWDQAAAFRQALRERSALDRENGVQGFIMTAWNGGLGTPAQTVMIRVSAESQAADVGPNAEARRASRAAYRAEWGRLSGIMNAASWSIERHDQTRRAALSHTGN